MRPFGPVPLILPRSAPSSRANLRTDGLAYAVENAFSSIDPPPAGGAADHGASARLGRLRGAARAFAACSARRAPARRGGFDARRLFAGVGADSASWSLRCACRLRCGRRCRGLRLLRRARAVRLALEQKNQAALGDLVAFVDFDLGDAACGGRRHVHGGFFGFQRDQRRFFLDLLAVLDQHVDHVHILEAADIGDENFDGVCHGAQTVSGLGFSGSMSKAFMALVTVFTSILPSSASALSAAITM